MKNLYVIFFIVWFFCGITKVTSAEKLFDVVTNDSSADKRAIAFVDTVTGKDRIVEVNMSGEVVWEWEFPSELQGERKRSICQGADIKYLKSRDEILFIVPRMGAYKLNRAGKLTTIIEDDEISHDIDALPNGNFIYVRGRVDKGDDEVREVSPSGAVVWRWSHAKYFPVRENFLKNIPKNTLENWRERKGILETDGVDWAHVNGVERQQNGNTLISLRNFSMFVIVDPKGRPKKLFKDIWLVHEPHKTGFGYIASDRFSGGGAPRFSIVKILAEGKREKLLTKQFFAVRGIELMPHERFNITSVGNVFEIDKNGTVLHRMHLSIQKEDAERHLGGDRKPGHILDEGRCAPLNLYKVVKTKVY
tara:strand:- start:1903 stop:2991 length:1089 start_codon:yes stop_codon:yes gene_type:complete